ncbi:unnamed protein product [Prorocentrum cordatum]|uniref:Heparan-sulfate 6-O-sulfotransferase n=1 Tax=Prorocentrum cordatum TaxID=2364126 RepID=A0ABN9SDV3_9DINO|nr:unnamed protein product [Polarella glacialis]
MADTADATPVFRSGRWARVPCSVVVHASCCACLVLLQDALLKHHLRAGPPTMQRQACRSGPAGARRDEPMEALGSGEPAGLRVGTCSPLRAPAMPLWSASGESPTPATGTGRPRWPDAGRQLLLMHVRKAGGTTLRHWVHSACTVLKNTADCAWEREGASINNYFYFEYLAGPRAKITIAIINIREPLARTQSLVSMNIAQRDKSCKVQDAKVLSSEKCLANNSVDAELQRIRECFSIRGDLPVNAAISPLYECGADVYVKTLVGTSDEHYLWSEVADEGRHSNTLFWDRASSQELERAKQRLVAFHGVAITEWLNFVAFEDFMVKIVMGLHNRIRFGSAYPTQHKTRSGDSTRFTPEQMRAAERMNEQDVALYDYAKRLVLQRMVGAGYC